MLVGPLVPPHIGHAPPPPAVGPHPSAAGDLSSTPVNDEVTNYTITTAIDLPPVDESVHNHHQLPDVGSLDQFLDSFGNLDSLDQFLSE